MAVVILRCSCGERFRIHMDRKDTANFHAHFGRSVECDGTCHKARAADTAPADPCCADLQPRQANGQLAAAFA